MFANLGLIASPCSVMTTASDDEFSLGQQTLQNGTAAPTFLLSLVCRACTRSFSKLQDRCSDVPSPVQPLQWCLSVPADVTPVHQVHSKLHQPAEYPCVGRDSGPYAELQCGLQCPGLASNEPPAETGSFQCSGLTSNEPHCTFDDPTGLAFSNWRTLGRFGFLLDGLVQSLSPVLQLPARCRPEGDSVMPKLVDEPRCSLRDPGELRPFPHVILCLRSRMTSTRDTCSSASVSPRNAWSIDTCGTPSKSS